MPRRTVHAVTRSLGPNGDPVVREDRHASPLLPQVSGRALPSARGPEEQDPAPLKRHSACVDQDAASARQAGEEDHLVERVDERVELAG